MKCAREGCSQPTTPAGRRGPKPKFCSESCYQRHYYYRGRATRNKRRAPSRRNPLPDFVVAMAKLKEG